MNQIGTTQPVSQPAKRGTLARRLAQAAKRQARSNGPPPPLTNDESKGLADSTAKVLGPYGNGAKWRLVIKEGAQRKSLVFETEQEALAVHAQLSGEFIDRASRTIGEVLGEHLESKRKAGCVERTIRTFRDKIVSFLPVNQLLTSLTPVSAERLYCMQTQKSSGGHASREPKVCQSAFYVLRKEKIHLPESLCGGAPHRQGQCGQAATAAG
jgi:hypothetical protein